MNSAVPIGHGPVREALIEVTSQESNQRRIDPGIDVEAVHGEQPIAIADRNLRRTRTRPVGAAHRIQACVPQSMHGPPFILHAIVQLTQRGQRSLAAAGTSVRKRDSAAVSSRIQESSRPLATGMP
jgi:hypothetical protein